MQIIWKLKLFVAFKWLCTYFQIDRVDKDGDTVHFDGIEVCLNFKLKTLPDPIPFEGVRSPASEAQPFQLPFFCFRKNYFDNWKKNIAKLNSSFSTNPFSWLWMGPSFWAESFSNQLTWNISNSYTIVMVFIL